MDSAATQASSIKSSKKKCLKAISNDVRQHWDDHLSWEVQGKFSDIIGLEKEEGSWRRIINLGLPSGQLAFILKAGSDSLLHPMHLRRWKIQCNSKCLPCKSPRPTTAYILNACPSALEQGHYTWRHDSVLKSILLGLCPLLAPGCSLFADLDHWRAEDNPPATIPPILSSSLCPDMVRKKRKSIYWNSQSPLTPPLVSAKLVQGNKTNQTTYFWFLIWRAWAGQLTVEIGSLGHLPQLSCMAVCGFLSSANVGAVLHILLEAARISIACSHQIFLAHKQLNWSGTRPLLTPL